MENLKNYSLGFEYNEGVLESDNPPYAEDFIPVCLAFEQACPDTVAPGVVQRDNHIMFSTNNIEQSLPILKTKLEEYGRIRMDSVDLAEVTE